MDLVLQFFTREKKYLLFKGTGLIGQHQIMFVLSFTTNTEETKHPPWGNDLLRFLDD